MAAELCREWLKMNQRTDFHGNEGTCRPVWLTDVLLRLLDKWTFTAQRKTLYQALAPQAMLITFQFDPFVGGLTQ